MPVYDTVLEKVPAFKKRPGDLVLAGSNNATLVLGSDVKHRDDGSAGAAYLGSGRAGERIDLSKDASFIYLSMSGDPDDFAGTTNTGVEKAQPTGLFKSDHVRIVAAKSLKVKVGSAFLTMTSDGSIVLEGNIKFGSLAFERALKGDSFVREFMQHTHTTTSSGAPTSPPIAPVTPAVFSRKVLVE